MPATTYIGSVFEKPHWRTVLTTKTRPMLRRWLIEIAHRRRGVRNRTSAVSAAAWQSPIRHSCRSRDARTDAQKFRHPTQSYRTRQPLRVTGEVTEWQGHSPERLKEMKDISNA
jgi:hypothetical protein